MSYVSSILHSGEEVLYQTRLHWVNYLSAVGMLLLGLFIWEVVSEETHDPFRGIVAFLPGIALFAYHWLQQRIEEHVVTTERAISRWGIIRRDVFMYPLDAIQTVDVHQGLLGRLLGYGSVEIHTAVESHGTGGRHYISDPEEWRRQIIAAMAAHKSPPAVPPVTPPVADDVANRLRQLEELRREGLVTEHEYQEKRSALMALL